MVDVVIGNIYRYEVCSRRGPGAFDRQNRFVQIDEGPLKPLSVDVFWDTVGPMASGTGIGRRACIKMYLVYSISKPPPLRPDPFAPRAFYKVIATTYPAVK